MGVSRRALKDDSDDLTKTLFFCPFSFKTQNSFLSALPSEIKHCTGRTGDIQVLQMKPLLVLTLKCREH